MKPPHAFWRWSVGRPPLPTQLLAGLAIAVFALIVAGPAVSADLSFQVVENEKLISQLDFDKAEITFETVRDQPTGFYGLLISLPVGRVSEFANLTGANVGRQLQVSVSGTLIADAVIREQISGGQFQISRIEKSELSDIVEKLRR